MAGRLLLGLFLVFAALVSQARGPDFAMVGQSDKQQQTPSRREKSEDPQLSAMRSDLQRMRVLVNQMQMNLGFVQNTTTPLRHQFELEIEMWQILMNQMDRRLQTIEEKPSADGPR